MHLWDPPGVVIYPVWPTTGLVHTGTVTTSLAAPPTRAKSARHRRSRATTPQIASIAAICVLVGTIAAATTTAAPTGSTLFDVFYRAALVVVTAVAGSRARRWSLAVGAGLVTLGAGGLWGVTGLAALGLTFALAWEDRRHRVSGALAGALIGLTALHLGWPRTTFATAVLAAAATLPVWISGYRTSSRSVRRRVRITAAVFVGVAVVGFAAATVFAVTQASNVQAAIDESLGAADRIGASSTAASTAGFSAAHGRLTRVVAAADAPWMVPARALPVLGVNLSSVRDSAAAGATLARAAADLSARVDYDRIHREGGGIDLVALRSFQGPLEDAEDALATSDATLRAADSPFLLPPIADRMASLGKRVTRAHHDATTARMGAQVAPELLGGTTPRRYLLLLGNPAEARDLGGHLGNWAEIVAADGHFQVVRVGAPYDMFGPMSETRPFLPDAATFPRSLTEMNPTMFPQNWGASPDLPTVARLAAELFPQVPVGGPLDGVIYADTKAFAAALAITGPVTVPGTGLSLDGSTGAEFLERGQFGAFERESTGDTAVTGLVRDALHKLLEGRLPSPDAIASNFGPVSDTGHLRFFSLHPDELPFLRRLGLDGAVRPTPGADLLAVINRNANPSKIDSYLKRATTDHVTFDPATGSVRADVEVTLTNTAPASGLPKLVGLPPHGAPIGTNRTELAVLSPLRATGATLDGEPAAIGTRTDIHDLNRHGMLVDLAPGQTRTVVFHLEGKVDGPDYRLRWIGQPLVNADDAKLSIRSTGARFRGGVSAGTVKLDAGDQDVKVWTER